MRNDTKILKILVSIYTISSILGLLILMPCYELSLGLFVIGACSPYLTFALFCSESIPQLAGLLAFIWFALFPLFLIAAYVLALKKRYIYFWIATVLDLVIMAFYGIYVVRAGNPAGLEIVGADILFSMIFSALFAYIIVGSRKHKTDNNSQYRIAT